MTQGIFDYPEVTPTSGGPRCSMCARPARWNAVRAEWAKYCSGNMCSNHQRLCKQCGRDFTVNAGGAGTKYCSVDCKMSGYGLGRAQCAWCGEWGRPSGRTTLWPYVCVACLDPIAHVVRRLQHHHVSLERARKLTIDPYCETGCGTDLLQGSGQLNVDHDHRCCPGSRSCGECVRGFICNWCNAAAGQLGDDAQRALALYEYLAAWDRQRGAPA